MLPRRRPLTRRTPPRSRAPLASIVPLVRRTPLHPGRPAERARPGEPLAPRCEARIDGVCTGQPTDRHHLVRRGKGGGDEAANTVDICRACHGWVHDHPAWAVEHGLLATSGGWLRWEVVADCRPDCDGGHPWRPWEPVVIRADDPETPS